jgi:hypothetical protein
MSAAARPWAWSGARWQQQASGNWTQRGGAAQQPWAGGWGQRGEATQQAWDGWKDWNYQWPSKSKSRGKAKEGKWVDYGKPSPAGSPSPPQAQWGGSKEEAAAQAVLLRQQIEELNPHPCFDSTRVSLHVLLEAAEKKAVDKRTCTQKLHQAEVWVGRAQKRVESERAKLLELTAWIDQQQQAITKEHENIAKLRSQVGTEPEAAEFEEAVDAEADTAQSEWSELARLEAKELDMRRKRWGANLTEAERAAFDQQATQLLEQVGQKRRKLEHNQEMADAYA